MQFGVAAAEVVCIGIGEFVRQRREEKCLRTRGSEVIEIVAIIEAECVIHRDGNLYRIGIGSGAGFGCIRAGKRLLRERFVRERRLRQVSGDVCRRRYRIEVAVLFDKGCRFAQLRIFARHEETQMPAFHRHQFALGNPAENGDIQRTADSRTVLLASALREDNAGKLHGGVKLRIALYERRRTPRHALDIDDKDNGRVKDLCHMCRT